jgi:hypothetical protein
MTETDTLPAAHPPAICFDRPVGGMGAMATRFDPMPRLGLVAIHNSEWITKGSHLPPEHRT